MQNETTPAEGKDSAQTESESALRDAACSPSSVRQMRMECQKCGGYWVSPENAQRLMDERDQAVMDTKRLDWLQSRRKTVWKAYHDHWGISTADPFMRAKIEVFDGWVVDGSDEPKESIREAIDAAISLENAIGEARADSATSPQDQTL